MRRINLIYLSVLGLLLTITQSCKEQKFDIEHASSNICTCYNAIEIGSLDLKVGECLEKYEAEHRKDIQKFFTQDSGRNAIYHFSLTTIEHMLKSCDGFFHEAEALYINLYPVDSSQENFQRIDHLAFQINTMDNVDSLVQIVEERIERNLRARNFHEALAGIERMHVLNPEDFGTYLAAAYAQYSMGEFKLAWLSVEKALELSQNPDLELFKVLIEHRHREALLTMVI